MLRIYYVYAKKLKSFKLVTVQVFYFLKKVLYKYTV